MPVSPFRFVAPLRALALLAFLASCGGGDKAVDPPRATTISVASNTSKGAVGEALAAPPTVAVLDQRGQPMAGVPISVSVSGGGAISGTPSVSGTAPVSVGTWTLGTMPGPQTLTVSSATLTPGAVTVTVDPGPPASVSFSSAPPVSARAGDSLTAQGRVSDRYGNALSGVAVQADFTLAGASAVPSTLTTDAAGIFKHTIYAGEVKGSATWSVSVQGVASARASSPVRVMAAAASQILVVGTAAGAPANKAAPRTSLVARDRFGNGSEDPVSFTVTRGGGSLAAAVATPDATGHVSMPAWTMGRLVVPQTVRATSGLATLDVTTGVTTDYRIEVRFWGAPMTDEQKALFMNAAARWSGVITGDVTDVRGTNVSLNTACGVTGEPLLNEVIDDVIIYASIQPIDGVDGVLAQAGPCLFRGGVSQLPAVGVMAFDSADLAAMSANGSLERVITHEMGHVLGIGSLYWRYWGFLSGYGGSDPQYVASAALAACRSLVGGSTLCARGVPVENTGGQGTYGAHWRTSTFQTELMVGYANPQMLLGPVTIGTLYDIGYTVNSDAAEDYRFPGFGLRGPTRPLVQGPWERTPEFPFQILGPDGSISRVLPIEEALRRSPGAR